MASCGRFEDFSSVIMRCLLGSFGAQSNPRGPDSDIEVQLTVAGPWEAEERELIVVA